MKYGVVYLGLLSLNSFASESQVCINNKSKDIITVYYQCPNGLHIKNIPAETNETLPIKTSSKQSPHLIYFQWSHSNKSAQFVLQNPGRSEFTVYPAIVITQDEKIAKAIVQSSSSSSFSSESQD